MNTKLLVLLILLTYIKSDYTHVVVLNDADTTIDGTQITSDNTQDIYIQDGENIIHYESEYANEEGYGASTDSSEQHSKEECNKEKLITIKKSGTYLISGNLYGQLAIEGESTDTFTLYFNGVNITSKVAPAVIFYKANEIDSNEYEDTNTKITYEVAKNLDFTNVGAKVVIKDDSVNYIQGSHVAKCFKYTVDENNTRTYTTSKRAKYDGSFYSKISMAIEGETNQNGVLYITADNEGLDTEKHLLINGAIIKIASQDDGINTNEEGGSVTLIKSGTVYINGGLGNEGDGIDSNGYLIVSGGSLISAGKPLADSGIDADNGIVINGGNVIAVGSAMDGASDISEQYSLNLQFSQSISSDSVLTIKDDDSNVIVNFSVGSVDLFKNTGARYYTGMIVSNDKFSAGKNYYLFIDDVQYGISSGNGQLPGFPNNNGSMPEFNGNQTNIGPNGQEPPSFPNNNGSMPEFNGNQTNMGPNGQQPQMNNQMGGMQGPGQQSTSQQCSTKSITLSSKVSTFRNIQKCASTETETETTNTETTTSNNNFLSTATTTSIEVDSNTELSTNASYKLYISEMLFIVLTLIL